MRSLFLAVPLAALALTGAQAPHSTAAHDTWSVSRNGQMLQINYGPRADPPQYAVVDLSSSYFRMVYSTSAGWGTSVILLPALWSQSACPTDYCQGAPVAYSWHPSGANLKLTLHGTIAKLKVALTVTISPPAHNAIEAQVTAKVAGKIRLDNRPGEAFKPVMLSSMHESATKWDSRAATAGSVKYSLPANGWIIQPPATSASFSLLGGTSKWKKNAPTVQIALDHSRQVTGWVTQDTNPNHDNVGFWCATTKVLHSWTYTITSKAA